MQICFTLSKSIEVAIKSLQQFWLISQIFKGILVQLEARTDYELQTG
jgi:hypothetical protein